MDKRNIKANMVSYLQTMMDSIVEREAWCDSDDQILRQRVEAMIACKEMVEAVTGMTIELRSDGKVIAHRRTA